MSSSIIRHRFKIYLFISHYFFLLRALHMQWSEKNLGDSRSVRLGDQLRWRGLPTATFFPEPIVLGQGLSLSLELTE